LLLRAPILQKEWMEGKRRPRCVGTSPDFTCLFSIIFITKAPLRLTARHYAHGMPWCILKTVFGDKEDEIYGYVVSRATDILYAKYYIRKTIRVRNIYLKT